MRTASYLTFILLSLLAIVYGAQGQDDGNLPAAPIYSEELWLEGADFAAGTGDGAIVAGGAITTGAAVITATYTSPQIAAPRAFSALVPSWDATLPEGASLAFAVRTGGGEGWTAWTPLPASEDLTLPESGLVTGDMFAVPAADGTHDRLQFRLILVRAPQEDAPRVDRLRLVFIDASAGPTTAELVAQQRAKEEPPVAAPEGGYPKPAVIPRSVWCTSSDCNYSDGLSYYPVSHLILHHTVTSSGGDSAAIVRAIWYYHTYDNGWGDIGYNYLVDINGVLFEGHLGGDDVVGTHAAGANSGSMALSMIGNFSDVAPPQPMFNAAAELFAWKADQKGIDVYDASYLPYVDWGLPHLMGHRDVYGTTQCPGTAAHALLPALRSAVASRIGFTPEPFYYDELDPKTHFSRNSATWYDGPYACGFNTHAYYAWSTTNGNEPHNWAEWRPEVSLPGRYQLFVYAPYCKTNARDTNGAVYRVTDLNGTSTVVVNQEANLGVWKSLGYFTFAAGTGGQITLTNQTATDDDWGVWFDAIRLLYLDPAAVNQSPAPGSWLGARTVTFSWSQINSASISQQRLQVAPNGNFAQMVLDLALGATTTSAQHTFAADYPALSWRIKVTGTDGSTFYSTPTSFAIDSLPPQSAVEAVYRFTDGRLLVAWQGEDAGTGVTGYNIDYRADGTSNWIRWLTNTNAENAFFNAPQPGTTYWLRSQAMDGFGHTEAPHAGSGDISTAQTTWVFEQLRMPLFYP